MNEAQKRTALRSVLVAGQAASILVTWPLWQPRAEPALLPLVELPPLSFGVALLVSLALVLVWPIVGTTVHMVLLAFAIVADQTREQPQLLSLAVLLLATLPCRSAREVGVLHLCALWFWAGIGKLTSPRFLQHGGAWLCGDGGVDLASTSVQTVVVAIAVGVAEVALAILAALPRTRPVAAWLGAAMHLSILVSLSPIGRDWNPAVWPWNAALAVAAVILLRGVGGGLREMLGRGVAVRAAAAVFVLLPIGFHLGLVDAPIAQQVYSDNACHAVLLRADGRVEVVGRLATLRTQLPPVPRVFRVWFRRHGRPGDRLILVDDRPLAAMAESRERLIAFEDSR